MEELNKEEMLGIEGGACNAGLSADTVLNINSIRKGEMIFNVGKNVKLETICIDFFRNRKRNENSDSKFII